MSASLVYFPKRGQNSLTIETSGTYDAPVTGYVNVLLCGGGGGGQAGQGSENDTNYGGAGGAGGNSALPLMFKVYMTKGEDLTAVIGAGGIGGAGNMQNGAVGTSGGNGGDTTLSPASALWDLKAEGALGGTGHVAGTTELRLYGDTIGGSAGGPGGFSGTNIIGDNGERSPWQSVVSSGGTASVDNNIGPGRGGGGGASGAFGPGGDGGQGYGTTQAQQGGPGQDAPAGSYGAGGGGGGTTGEGTENLGSGAGGDGQDGVIIIFWD